ncbi:ClpP/crotonase-like domain-containing protein [Zychaea mexicana]|uniref:ClpP/crotonase-like domain-containing protein n=1 Tax=Zychaea mexicana TaxID=64656 RepID=UPI0022FE5127|nr:ClpP/crotonase-like domain-containing protein [Zychaea mexicana]KAI9493699.1 ClpP/crotonase-like domain-containing protein [Zychaea mexicana]
MASVSLPLALPSTDKHYMTLRREGPLYILHLHNNQNRFTTKVCKAILYALQVIEDDFLAQTEPTEMALVTVGDSKFFSNGLDLRHAHSYLPFMDNYILMVKKLLTFTIPTVAAINGHAFAGGCLLALAHDYRVMRTERGYMCMNEIDLPAPLPPGFNALLRYKTTPKTLRALVLQGHRFNAQEALEHDLVDIICPENELLDTAKKLALKWAPKAKAGFIYRQLKEELSTETIRSLSVPYNRLQGPRM